MLLAVLTDTSTSYVAKNKHVLHYKRICQVYVIISLLPFHNSRLTMPACTDTFFPGELCSF